MDTNAYLKRHGWRGDGHSLDTTNRGISRPLLVSKKVEMLGVGLNKHAAVSDQWWMRAFDEGLKNLGSGTKSTLANVREKGVHFGGLYGRFVKGETVKGTIEDTESREKKAEGGENIGKKRKRDSGGKDVDKNAKRKVEGTDSAAGEQLVKRVERQTKAAVREAVERGLITKGGKDNKKTRGKRSPKIDETAYAQIFAQAGLADQPALAKDSQKSSGKQAKLVREKLRRELKLVARAYFTSQLTTEDRELVERVVAMEEMQRSSNRELKQVEKYNLAAQRSIAKATKQKERLEQKQANSIILSAEKAARYAERAAAKGVSVEDYIRRRGEKSATKKSQHPNDAAIAFVVDTTGDSALKSKSMLPCPPTTAPASLDVVDRDGNVRYTVVPGTPVPLDPAIWVGVDTKKLPKVVRQARKEWMANKRSKSQRGAGESLEEESGMKRESKKRT